MPATTALLGLSCCAEQWCGSEASLVGRTVGYFLLLEVYITPSDAMKASTSWVLHPLFLGWNTSIRRTFLSKSMGQKHSLFLGAKAILEFPLVYVNEFLPVLKDNSLKLRFFLTVFWCSHLYHVLLDIHSQHEPTHVFLISKFHRENSLVCLTLWIILPKNVIQSN